MKLNLLDKLNFELVTCDHHTTHIRDFYFDKKKWTLRYALVEFKGDYKLISVSTFTQLDWNLEKISTNLQSKEIAKLPSVNMSLAIQRSFEKECLKIQKAKRYWKKKYIKSMENPSLLAPTNVLMIDSEYYGRVPKQTVGADDNTSKIVSFSQILNFEMFASNGKVGNLVDLIFDNKDWRIISAVIHSEEEDLMLPLSDIDKFNLIEKGAILSKDLNEVQEYPQFRMQDLINDILVAKRTDFTGKTIIA